MATDVGVGFTNDSSQEELSNREALIAEERNPELTACKTALTPPSYIMELPEDVLRIIFDLMCQIVILNPRFDIPLALSYVCSAWRHTILNMPHIWAQFPIRIQLPTNVDYMGYPRLCLFHLWLTRGGSLPRTELSLYNYDGHHSDVVKHLVAPFTFLKLRLAFAFDEMHTLKEIPPKHMLRLQTLHIGCYGSSKETIPANTLRLPPRLPCLVDLTLCSCFAMHLGELITAVPWHNLKELFLQFDIPSTTCLNVILRQGMSLVSCALKPTSDATFSSLPDTEPSIVLPRMDSLVLHCSSDADVATFERLVLTPAVSTRRIEMYAYYGDEAYRPSLHPLP
ncbi:hypothetical protein F5887DRAFT_1073868 [Amanita rubescens]|nr:hypothetical protein F5887DRAFT_1073868 [Amanita rubescens]